MFTLLYANYTSKRAYSPVRRMTPPNTSLILVEGERGTARATWLSAYDRPPLGHTALSGFQSCSVGLRASCFGSLSFLLCKMVTITVTTQGLL